MLIAVSYLTILGVRSFDGEVPAIWWSRVGSVLPLIVAVHLIANVATGSYGHVWEYASIGEAKRVIAAGFWASSFLILGSLALGWRPVPLSVLTAGGLLSLFCLSAVRFRSRLFSFHRSLKLESRDRALILGDGKRAAEVARSAWWDSNGINVVGFVSPDSDPGVRRLAGLPVLGELNSIASLVTDLEIDQVVVVAEGASALARKLLDLCSGIDVRLRIVPDLDDVMVGNHGGPDIRDLEINDLLLRPPISTDLSSVEAILTGRRVLVTGAGGSIGSEIVTQILQFAPAELVAMDHDETHLHDGMLGWKAPPGTSLVQALVDLRDHRQLARLIAIHEPEVIFHAAAHKHVPILEDWPEEAVKTNIVGTNNLLESVRGTGLERFILISTDKTVAPTGAMGASKRVAEMLVQSAAATRSDGCSYGMVRFGNVLGSRGSVVPTFMEQIRLGGPVTITDERMTRYFMTIGEAVELVLQASALAEGGEVFVLDMRQPVRIIDLAHRMIRLGGLVPGRDIEVAVSGIRPGEKLYEELATGPLLPSAHPKINVAEASWPGPATLSGIVEHLDELAVSGHSDAVKELLLAVANREWSQDETIDLRGTTVAFVDLTGAEDDIAQRGDASPRKVSPWI
jgi:FlaA1/EpsC-like NDP-sugar epimerase